MPTFSQSQRQRLQNTSRKNKQKQGEEEIEAKAEIHVLERTVPIRFTLSTVETANSVSRPAPLHAWVG